MAEPTRKDELEHEALGYIQLGTLVRRPRSEDKSEAVAHVLAENMPVEEKIRRIERIDAGAAPPEERKAGPRAAPAAGAAPVAGAAPAAVAAPTVGRPASSPSAAEAGSAPVAVTMLRSKQSIVAANKSRARILADIAPTTLMRYVFFEGMEIRSKAKGNRFLKSRFLSVSLAKEAARFFLEAFKRDLGPLLAAALESTLRDGWRFLSKSEYNRFAALKKLVTEIGNLVPQGVGLDDAQNTRRFFSLEVAFLSLRADASCLVEIAAGFDKVLAKMSYPRKMIDEARSVARRILQNGGPPPCLQDLILAVNMVRSRRFLRIKDLMSFDNAALMSVTEFDCSDEVQDVIDARIAELGQRLDALARENEEVLRLRAFVRRDSEGDIDYAPLVALYESDKDRKRSWEKDENNVVLIVSGLAERFLAMLAPLLGSSLPVLGIAKAVPHSGPGGLEAAAEGRPGIQDQALEYEVSRLRSTGAKLDKLRFYLPNLPWPRFLAIRSRATQATKYEADAVGLVAESADLFYRCGSRMVELLRSREGLAGPAPGSGDAEAEGKGELSLEDLALRQSLSTATSAAYLAALRFQEPTIAAALKNERQAADQRRSVLDEIERLADVDTFKAARQKIGLA